MFFRTFILSWLAACAIFFFGAKVARAQDYALEPSKSSITIKGASSLHDWTLTAQAMDGAAQLEADGNGPLSLLYIVLPVSGLRSESARLAANAQEALKSKEHPQISFTLKKSRLVTAAPSRKGPLLRGTGELRIAGRKKDVEFAGALKRHGANFTLKGKIKLNMADYGISPPSYFLLRVRPEVEARYLFSFRPTRSQK